MLERGFFCHKCSRPVVVYWARDFSKRMLLSPGYRNRDWVMIKFKCPRHGSYKIRLNAFDKETWVDAFAEAMYRCMKCGEIGTIANFHEHGPWVFFQINCPAHGLTDTKRIIATLYYLVADLQRQGIPYTKWVQQQPANTFLVCPKCNHIVEPLSKTCDVCGMSLVPE
jgi:hypothetical protein